MNVDLIIGISAQELKDIYMKNNGRVIGVSGGTEKAQAITAALLGNSNGKEPWIDTIIIDERTCEEVLKKAKE